VRHFIAGRVRSPARSHKPLPSLVQIQAPQPFASETWKSERSYKPFSARLAFLRGFDSLRWYQISMISKRCKYLIEKKFYRFMN